MGSLLLQVVSYFFERFHFAIIRNQTSHKTRKISICRSDLAYKPRTSGDLNCRTMVSDQDVSIFSVEVIETSDKDNIVSVCASNQGIHNEW